MLGLLRVQVRSPQNFLTTNYTLYMRKIQHAGNLLAVANYTIQFHKDRVIISLKICPSRASAGSIDIHSIQYSRYQDTIRCLFEDCDNTVMLVELPTTFNYTAPELAYGLVALSPFLSVI
jgi:hypothetical protein